MASCEERVSVAAFPWLGSGHVNPMVELSRRLVPLGFSVTIILSEKNCWTFQPRLQQEEHIKLVSVPDPDHSISVPQKIRECLKLRLRELVPPVKCLISDWFQGWTQDVAQDLGLPRVALVTGGANCEAIFSCLQSLVSEGYVPVSANPDVNSPITFIPGFNPIPKRLLPLVLHEPNPYAEEIGKETKRLGESLCILVNTVQELEEPVVAARNENIPYLSVGPLLPFEFLSDKYDSTKKFSDLDCSILRWLDDHAPGSVLYVAFGSEVQLPVGQVEKLAQALKNSGLPFVWAMRKHFVEGAPLEFCEQLMSSYSFEEQGLIVEWAPQLHVLQHKAVGAFFTHSGYNSIMESVCCGVPMLCWPCFAEQNLNAFTVEEQWKVGLRVAEGRKSDVKVEEIEHAIRSMMQGGQGEAMRRRIKEYRKIIREAVQGGSSHKNLFRFKDILLAA